MRLDRPGSGQREPTHVPPGWTTFTREGGDWLNEAGHLRLLRRGTVVVRRGDPLDTVFIVVSGRLGVQRSGRWARDADSVYPGEILDDALSTEKPPSSVALVAVQDSCVFAANKERLTVKLNDPTFADRFYRAVALLLACSADSRIAQRNSIRRPTGAASADTAEPGPRRRLQARRAVDV